MRSPVFFVAACLASLLFSSACKTKEGPKVIPTVSTKEVYKITDSSATITGNLADQGSSDLETVGVCWSVNSGPTRLDSMRVSGGIKGDFEFDATHLKNNTTYYVRAFATNKDGLSFGNELSFKTKAGWIYATPGDNPYVTALISVQNTVLLGTSSGVYALSTNAATWTPSNAGLGNLKVNCFASSGDDIYVGTEGGVFYSNNAGATWSPLNNNLGTINTLVLAASGPMLCAGTVNGVYVSADQGANWTKATAYPGVLNISMTAILGNRVFAGSKQAREIYFSADMGMNWTKLSKDFSNEAPSAITAYPPQLVVATESGLYYSNDVGNTLEKVPGYNAVLYCAVMTGNSLFAGGEAKMETLYFSRDHGTTFSLTENPGPNATYVTGLAKTSAYLFAVTGNKVYRMNF